MLNCLKKIEWKQLIKNFLDQSEFQVDHHYHSKQAFKFEKQACHYFITTSNYLNWDISNLRKKCYRKQAC